MDEDRKASTADSLTSQMSRNPPLTHKEDEGMVSDGNRQDWWSFTDHNGTVALFLH